MIFILDLFELKSLSVMVKCVNAFRVRIPNGVVKKSCKFRKLEPPPPLFHAVFCTPITKTISCIKHTYTIRFFIIKKKVKKKYYKLLPFRKSLSPPPFTQYFAPLYTHTGRYFQAVLAYIFQHWAHMHLAREGHK